MFTFTIAYAQIPEEYETVLMYDNDDSNDEITASVDKFNYKPGEIVKLVGYVNEIKTDERVIIRIIDPVGNIVSNVNIGVTNEGVFTVENQIPQDVPIGEYVISIKYGSLGTPLFLPASVEHESKAKIVKILFGSHVYDTDLTFSPKRITVEAGIPIIWKNEDQNVHTVVSGRVGFNEKLYADGKFDSGTFGPGTEFTLILEEGDYDYFCKLHPWLTGFIRVVPSTDPNYVPPQPEIIIVNEEGDLLNDGYIQLNTDRQFYFQDEKAIIFGTVEKEEFDQPVTIQIKSPNENIVAVEQIIPKSDKTFSLNVPLSGSLFTQNGNYKILAQYGIEKHKTEISFKFENPKFVSGYKGYDLYSASSHYAVAYNAGNLQEILFPKLLENPSFEISGINVGWSLPEEGFLAKMDSTTMKQGEFSYKIESLEQEQSWSRILGEIIDVKPGDIFDISFFLKQENSVSPHVTIELSDEIQQEWKLFTQIPTGNEDIESFTKFSKEITIPKGFAKMRLGLNAGSVRDASNVSATTWFDDIFVKKVGLDGYRIILESGTLAELKNKIDFSPPVGPFYLDESHREFNFVMYGGAFYAVKSLEEFDENRVESDEILSAFSIEELQTVIDDFIDNPVPIEEIEEDIVPEDIVSEIIEEETVQDDSNIGIIVPVIITILIIIGFLVYKFLLQKKS